MICEKCGNDTPKGAKLCLKCGEYLSENRQRDLETSTVWDYFKLLIILSIPLINIVMLFIWTFNGTVNKNIKNLAKAYLIYSSIILVVLLIAGVYIISIFGSMY